MAENTIAKLLKASPEEILGELNELRAQREVLELKEGVLEKVLELMQQESSEDPAWMEENLGAVGSVRFQIMNLLRTEAAPRPAGWIPREVHAALAQRGSRATIDNVRVTMRRMGERGELARPRGGGMVYALPKAKKIDRLED